MRSAWIATAGVLAATSASAFASPSNPAFLGISFGQCRNPIGACIESVTADSPAARAGLQPGDVITAVDSHVVTVTTLNDFIIGHDAGDRIVLTITRNDTELQIAPTLTTRAAMFDLQLGKPFAADVSDRDGVVLGKAAGHATVIAWYDRLTNGGNCIDPMAVVEAIQRRVAQQQSGVQVVGATQGIPEVRHDAVAHDRERLNLPIMIASPDSFQRYAISECSRVFATVVDSRGIVTFMTPISDGDDEDAALDEIATAAAQADHKRR